jgi:hypothetical protein
MLEQGRQTFDCLGEDDDDDDVDGFKMLEKKRDLRRRCFDRTGSVVDVSFINPCNGDVYEGDDVDGYQMDRW